jgi:hypothetical protein
LSYTPLSAADFKGLRLTADPQDLGLAGAVDLKNVELDLDGTVRTRPGHDQVFATTTAAPLFLDWFPSAGSANYLAIIGASDIRFIDADAFTNLSTNSTLSQGLHGTRFGDRYYYTDAAFPALRHYDLSANAYSTVASGPNAPNLVAVDRWERRLIAADTTTIYFSDPDTDTGMSTNTLTLLDEGEGYLYALVPWDNDVYVLAPKRIFVLTGTTTDATGGAIYNYRAIESQIGCDHLLGATAAPDGVYFVSLSGVYRTTGGTPQLVSQALQPFFDGRSNGFFTEVTGPLGEYTGSNWWQIRAGTDRLYLWKVGTGDVFMMDLKTREWVYWDLGVNLYGLLPSQTDAREFFFLNSTGQVYKFGPDYTTDDGTAIASHYQTGFVTISDGSKTRVRGFHLTGEGTVSHATAVDLGSVGTSASVTLGNPGYDMRSAQGRDLSLKLSATSGAWNVSKITGLVAGARGVR